MIFLAQVTDLLIGYNVLERTGLRTSVIEKSLRSRAYGGLAAWCLGFRVYRLGGTQISGPFWVRGFVGLGRFTVLVEKCNVDFTMEARIWTTSTAIWALPIHFATKPYKA